MGGMGIEYDAFTAKVNLIFEVPLPVRVARGVALLDGKLSDWWQLIDLETLDMGEADQCIVGQLHGGEYDAGLSRLTAEDGDGDEWHARKLFSYRHGFDTKWQDMGDLAVEWRRVILERRAAAALTVNELTEVRIKGDAAAELAASLRDMDLKQMIGEKRFAELCGSMPPEILFGFSVGAEAVYHGMLQILEAAAVGGRNGTWLS